MWQTPTADDAANREKGKWNSRGEPKLSAEVLMWPTPVADDTGHRTGKYKQGGTALSMATGGKLNPPWVEWLMGWPIGWTDCEPLETGRCQQWLRSHGLSCCDG